MHFMPSSEHRELECLEELRMKKCQVVMRNEEESDYYSSRTNSTSTVTRVRYGECRKNHAANIGGYAVDGCREFLGSGEEGTAAALTCACCGCHRSFHRREVQTELVCNDHDSSSSTT